MKEVEVKSRNDPFVSRASTTICCESASEEQGYVTHSAAYYGYSVQELMDKGYSQTDMVFLMLSGELPSREQRQLLDALSVVLCNPGPRHPATRSVMEAAVSKTHSPHFIPIGLMVLGGELAAGAVESAMRYMLLHINEVPSELAGTILNEYKGSEEDPELIPGFGPHFGQREPMYIDLGNAIRSKFIDQELAFLEWSLEFDQCLLDTSCGLKTTALAAAIFLDLGFDPRMGPGLFQLLSSPGLLAHGIEMIGKPLTAMPFVNDENYHHIGAKNDE